MSEFINTKRRRPGIAVGIAISLVLVGGASKGCGKDQSPNDCVRQPDGSKDCSHEVADAPAVYQTVLTHTAEHTTLPPVTLPQAIGEIVLL